MNEKDKIIEYVKMLMKEFNTIILLMLISLLLTYFSHTIFTILFIASLSMVAYKIVKVNSFVSKIDEILKEDIEYTGKVDELMKCHKEISKKRNEEINKEVIDTLKDDNFKTPIEEIKEEVIEEIKEETNDDVVEDIVKEDIVNDVIVNETINKEEITDDIKEEIEAIEKDTTTQIKDIKKENIEDIIPVSYVNNFDYVDEVEDVKQPAILVKDELEENSTKENLEEVSTKEDEIKEEKKEETKEEIKTEIDISKCIRKLPKGRKASEKAKSLALSYGYELKEGETFIAPKKKAD